MTNFVAMAYTNKQRQDIFTEICDLIIQGESLRSALSNVKKIHATDFFDWLRKYEEFGKQYAQATEERAQFMFEKMLDIANEQPDRMPTKFGDAVDPGFVQDKRVKLDTMKWAMSKMMPKKYGTKADDQDDNHDNEITVKIV